MLWSCWATWHNVQCAHVWWKCLTHTSVWIFFPKCTNTEVFRAPEQAMTNLWHLHSTPSQVFSKSGMHGRICGKQKQRLKRVTGSALISMSWENAREFSTIVRSLREVISFPINYVPRRSSRLLQCERPSLLSYVCAGWSKHFRETVWRIQLPVMYLPSHFSDKEQWPPHN